MVGTRGVPARYGGFETAIEEIGSRLVAKGHNVVVYCRGEDRSKEHLGMRRVVLPALKHPVMETLSHTALSVLHLLFRRADVVLVFNAANAPLVPVIRKARMPVAVHVDGLEWKRGKWGKRGRQYYLANERLAVRVADALIADAEGIQDYYREKYDAETILLAYGAPILEAPHLDRLVELDLMAGEYHLVVARMEPENNVDMIIKGYSASDAALPLIVVGSVPYPSDHERQVKELAARDSRIRLLGGLWDQELLDALYAGCASYLHGHHVGGTNPSLLRAMGAAAPVTAFDVNFNRDVLGDSGLFFSTPEDVRRGLLEIETDHQVAISRGKDLQERARSMYRWENIAIGYERLCKALHRNGRRHLLNSDSMKSSSR